MKAIQISSHLEKHFRHAAQLLGLSVEALTMYNILGQVAYRVINPGVSQHQLFLLGALTWQLASKEN